MTLAEFTRMYISPGRDAKRTLPARGSIAEDHHAATVVRAMSMAGRAASADGVISTDAGNQRFCRLIHDHRG